MREHDPARVALGSFVIVRMIEYAALLPFASSRSRYSSMSNVIRATPDSIAAFATAGATHHSTRGSNGFGMK